jgi:hypothetical protein
VSLALAEAARDDAPPVRSEGDWERSFGRHWKVDLTVMAVVVFLFGAIRPLADPDLPMHLTIGEWIARHRAVPFTEPFSWTASGQPYFAYSWLPQWVYFETLSTFGHLGLRALQGVLVLSSAAAALLLARAAGWRPSMGVMLAGFNLIVAAFFVAMLRPQSILLITLPVIWAMFTRVARGDGSWKTVFWIFLSSALTANSHLFFPVTLAPAAALWVHRRVGSGMGVAAILGVVAGWMTSPYSLQWPNVFRHNFGSHALTSYPSPISEMRPGFVAMVQPPLGPMLLLVTCMLAVPWILAQSRQSGRERLVAAVYWIVGAIAFGYAVRLFLLWWVLSIVSFGAALAWATRGTTEAPPRRPVRLLGLFACLLIISAEVVRTGDLRALEGSTSDRVLPTFGARPAERVARWLRSNTAPDAQGRIMTSFSFGSYLTWRLPGYSTSIDSRGLQPDSVTAAESVVSAAAQDYPLGPWRSADLAILPVHFRAAAVLDTATGWQRMAAVRGEPIPQDSAALWVRRDWWARNGRFDPEAK